ncbi:MAG: hypothetical protein QNJ47_22190 [Nostocaceae cyanobacterium]|nr:hypothetical protein [Nostocaceae cyanobacterium]
MICLIAYLCRLVIGKWFYHYQLPITNYQLPITNYPLPITHYQLPITMCQRLLTPS